MAEFRLSRDARKDIKDIAQYSLETFGRAQAIRYRDSLLAAFAMIADRPQIGSDFSHIRPQSRRLVHESHVIYYRVTNSGIFIQRILHGAQDPLRHL